MDSTGDNTETTGSTDPADAAGYNCTEFTNDHGKECKKCWEDGDVVEDYCEGDGTDDWNGEYGDYGSDYEGDFEDYDTSNDQDSGKDYNDDWHDNKWDEEDHNDDWSDGNQDWNEVKDKDLERQLKQWDRLLQRIDRTLERFDKQIERSKKYGHGGDLIDSLNDSKEIIEDIRSDVVTYRDETEDADTMTLLGGYEGLKSTLEMRFSVEEMLSGATSMEAEINEVLSEGELSSSVESKLEDVLDKIEDFKAYREAATDAYAVVLEAFEGLSDSDDPWAKQDFWDLLYDEVFYVMEDMSYEMDDFWFESEDIWTLIDGARKAAHMGDFKGEVKEELGFIREELEKLGEELEEIEGKATGEAKEAVKSLRELQEKGLNLLEEMEEELDSDDVDHNQMEDFWHDLKMLGELADKHIRILEEHGLIQDWDMGDKHKGDKEGEFKDFYGKGGVDVDKLSKEIKDELLKDVMLQVNDELMNSLSEMMDDGDAKELIRSILNNIDIYGEKGSKFLEATANVNAKIKEHGVDNLGSGVRQYIKDLKMNGVAPEYKDEYIALLEDLANGNADAEDFKRLNEKNIDALVLGEDQMRTYDSPLDAYWTGHQMNLMDAGVVSGYADKDGKATGYFGPGDPMTFAQMIKVMNKVCGVRTYSQDGTHWSEKDGDWAAANDLGVPAMFGLSTRNLEDNATREQAAVYIAEACGMNTSNTSAVFSDYDGSFPGHLNAVNDAGYFTGQGGSTENFDGNGHLERAAMAKVADMIMGDQALDDFFEYELKDY